MAWVQELSYGVERLRGRLRTRLDSLLDRGFDSLPPPVRTLMCMGAYQVLYMDSVPHYAAVSETVAAVVRHGPGLKGVSNAVLRRLASEGAGPEHFPAIEDDPVGYLSTWGSHPAWLVERWLARWPLATVQAMVEANNRIPDVCIRPFDTDVEEARTRLDALGIESTVTDQGRCLALQTGRDVRAAIEGCRGFVQDPAAARVVDFCAEPSASWAADLCAAPGGKALALSAQVPRVVALDRSAPRIALLLPTAARLGAPVVCGVADARHPPLTDCPLVLVDAPCTGTGTLRRHPDGRWRLSPEDITSLNALQDAILDGAARAVAPGGLLVYATCSVEVEENQDRVRQFLSRHKGFSLDLHQPSPESVPTDGTLSLLPTDTGYDGAFAARLRRIR